MSFFVWILSSMIIAIFFLLLSAIVQPESNLTTTMSDALSEPQERLQYLNRKINTKATRLQISRDKLNETKKSISELEMTSLQVQLKYSELLKQLKSELSKTEKECLYLHSQIEKIADKRDRLRMELKEVARILKNFEDSLSEAAKHEQL